MKDLLEQVFDAGSDWYEGMSNLGNPISFEQWYEQNKSKINDTVKQHLALQGFELEEKSIYQQLKDIREKVQGFWKEKLDSIL